MFQDEPYERRKVFRTKSRHIVQYRHLYQERSAMSEEEFLAVTVDLSELGATLITDSLLPEGTQLIIKFIINEDSEIGPAERKIIVFTGTVVNVLELGEELFRIGIYFGEKSRTNQTKFFNIVCSPSRFSLEEEDVSPFLRKRNLSSRRHFSL